MEYNFKEIEPKWQSVWEREGTFHAKENDQEKYYVLNMFPYPSGAGLHVGHPLGYIASDIYARYKRLKGFNVMNPMGYDAFGLPAEQYAIRTGQHPAITTEENLKRYREQLNKIGFSFDWSREIKTCDPKYYHWTQWIFIELFNAWYNEAENKAQSIDTLINAFEERGNANVVAATTFEDHFTAEDWNMYSEQEKSDVLSHYRLAYLSEAMVNWCPELGTVLANDEVKDGLSERGGHPVIQKRMKQWSLRITAYSERLLQDLNGLDWSDALKEVQRNWIGKSEGAQVFFEVEGSAEKLEVFTTRPDTIYGVSFMVLAPEHPMVNAITTEAQTTAVKEYQESTAKRSERDRMADTKSISGAFTGGYAIHPFTGKQIPIYISDYVLMGYGTGAIMAVPAGDQRDWNFANHFNIDIPQIIEGSDISESANESKEGVLMNSDFLNGKVVKDAIPTMIEVMVSKGFGQRKINYKLRDAVFGRQRYWGEPIPVYYVNGEPHTVKEEHLPIELPEVDNYKPTEDGEPPLARAEQWHYNPETGAITDSSDGYPLELTTMPGWAGSSWYYLRYEDPHNNLAFAAKDKVDYWGNVDLYMGGAEHATGHLLYVRFWTKFLQDIGHIGFGEPAKKLINQGMIQGDSRFVYRVQDSNLFVSKGLIGDRKVTKLHVDVNIVDGLELDTEAFKNWLPEYANAEFELENGKYICGSEVEKMSKSMYNVVNPDILIDQYGADALRLHEMFLGPIEMHKPWNTKGIDGVSKFLKRLWRLYFNEGTLKVEEGEPSKAAMKTLHKTIEKVGNDLERFSFNTIVSTLMVGVNEFTEQKCNNRAVLEQFIILCSCHAPHIAEEIWSQLGHETSISTASFPKFEGKWLVEDEKTYPVMINGKKRLEITFASGTPKEEIEAAVMAHETTQKWLDGKNPKRVIVVPNKIVNIVV